MSLRISMLLSLFLLAACGDDDGADSLGVAAQCTASDECDTENDQACLLDFKGGYCGIENCTGDKDCPTDSACVAHDDGTNYCFRTCIDKAECNENRDAENEANCAASITFVDDQEEGVKACVPPSA
jgi:hypothetical protein